MKSQFSDEIRKLTTIGTNNFRSCGYQIGSKDGHNVRKNYRKIFLKPFFETESECIANEVTRLHLDAEKNRKFIVEMKLWSK